MRLNILLVIGVFVSQFWKWNVLSILDESRQDKIDSTKTEKLVHSNEKEEYVPEVLATFTGGFSIPQGPNKKEAGPYEIGIQEWGETGGMITGPRSITIDEAGNIYILDVVNRRIQKYNPNGQFLQTVKKYGNDLYVDNRGNIYVVGFPFGFKKGEYERLCDLANINPEDASIFYIEELDLIGRSINIGWFPFSRDWAVENGFWPKEIFVDKNGKIYILRTKRASEKAFVFEFSESEILNLTEVIEGIPSESGKFYYIIEHLSDREFQVSKQEKNRDKQKIASISIEGEMDAVEYLGEDSKGNIYLCLWNLNDPSRRIDKIDESGNIVASIQDLPYLSDTGARVRDIVIDGKGDIYWLKYWADKGDYGGELIKWHKREER